MSKGTIKCETSYIYEFKACITSAREYSKIVLGIFQTRNSCMLSTRDFPKEIHK